MNGNDDTGASLGMDAGTAGALADVAAALSGGDFGGSDSGGAGAGVDAGTFGGGVGGGAGGEPTSPANALLSSEDILKRGRELALLGVPLQVSNLFEALAQLRARASGSTAEIFPAIIGQLSQLREQYSGASQAIARRLGFAGGGQVKREQGKALAGAARQYGGLITGDQQTSFANLINTLSGLQPALSGGARFPRVSTQNRPIDFSAQGAGIASIVSAARRLQNFYDSQGGVTTTGLANSGIRPENIIT